MARTERSTADFSAQQHSPLLIPEGLIDDDIRGGIIEGAGMASQDYQADLAFGEDPITIRIERGAEKHAPKVREVWVNGRGAEQLINGRWVTSGWLPVGVPVTTKRKYAEVLARACYESVSTDDGGDPNSPGDQFRVMKSRAATSPFTVLRDESPRAQDWIQRLMWEQ